MRISFDGNEIIFILFLKGEIFFFEINFNNFSLKILFSIILNEINSKKYLYLKNCSRIKNSFFHFIPFF